MNKVNLKAIQFTKEEAEYQEQSPATEENIMCSTCRFFNAPSEGAEYGSCVIVEGEIAPGGVSAYYVPLPGEDDAPDETEAETPEDETQEAAAAQASATDQGKGLLQWDRVNRGKRWHPANWFSLKRQNSDILKIIKDFEVILRRDGSAFKALGERLWIAGYTNNFKDLEDEIITGKAIERNIERMDAGLVPMPELWYGHVPGTKHGEAKWVAFNGHSAIAIGVFDDNEIGRAAERGYLKAAPGRYKLSHGFTYPTWAKQENHYVDLNTFEITTLDSQNKDYPANPYTWFQVKELVKMPIAPNKQQALQDLLVTMGKSPEAYRQIMETVNDIEENDKQVEQRGTAFKDWAHLSEEVRNAKSDKTQDAMKAFAAAITEGMGDIVETLDKLMAKQAANDAKVDAAVKELHEASAAYKDDLSRTPRRVDTDKSNVVPSGEATMPAELELLAKSIGEGGWYEDGGINGIKIIKKEFMHMKDQINKYENGKRNGAL